MDLPPTLSTAGVLPEQQRIIGRFHGAAAGPTIIVTAAVHGNEPAGLHAARRILEGLSGRENSVCGDLIAIAGNLAALSRKVRFLRDDLNRQWTPGRIESLRAIRRNGGDVRADDRQRIEMLEAMSEFLVNRRGPVYFIDLHTSSATGPPFLTVGDTLRNRHFAMNLPVPLMLGLEEQVDGSLLEYLNNRGFITLGVEGGQHDAIESIDHHEAVLWLALVASGLIRREDVPGYDAMVARLEPFARQFPAVLEVRTRHAITPDDGFVMEPGFTNFDPVRKGQLMAHDRNGPIHATETGRVILPLYQGKGDDGFFLAREFSPFWLRVSSWLRRLRIGSLLRHLPGVQQRPGDDDVLVVNTRIARIYPLEIFHLLGYRKRRRVGAALAVGRRAYDLEAPASIEL